MISIRVGDKVELKSDGQIYIVEEKTAWNQLSIRKYFQEETRQIDVTSDDVLILPVLPVFVSTDDESEVEDSVEHHQNTKRKREMESISRYSEFRKEFFKIPSEILFDPWYFPLIPNMTALMIWMFSLSLFTMSGFTVLFCVCSLVLENPYCWFCQTFLCFLVFFLSRNLQTVMKFQLKREMSLKKLYLLTLCQITIFTFFSIWLKSLVPSGWQTPILSFCVWGIISVLGRLRYFSPNAFLANVMFSVRTVSQLLLIQFWVYGPPEIIRIFGNHLGSFLILLLLKLSKHGYLQMGVLLHWWRQGFFHAHQLQCLFYASFVDVLVLSHAMDQNFTIMSMRYFFDLFEIIYRAKALGDQKDHPRPHPQAFNNLINWASSYICATEIVEIMVPVYFCIATFIFRTLGQNEQLFTLGLHTAGSSFMWSMIVLIIMKIVNSCLLRQILSLNNIWLTHDRFYLMENNLQMLFLTPLVLVLYFLITCHSFDHGVST